jgi:hypothetical protein
MIAFLSNKPIARCTEFDGTLCTIIGGIPPRGVVFDELEDSAVVLVSHVVALNVFESFDALRGRCDVLDNIVQFPRRPFPSPSPKHLFLMAEILQLGLGSVHIAAE